MSQIQSQFDRLKKNAWNQKNSRYSQRVDLLNKLEESILKSTSAICSALEEDFNKPAFETKLTEIFPLLEEIKVFKKNLKSWMKPQKVKTPITLAGSKSWIHMESKGCVLIISPWNYPFQLAVAPLIAALSAGNTVVIKPSELAPATSKVIKNMVNEIFNNDLVLVLEGGVEVSQQLLELPFDHIFFTGSTQVGKAVMTAAAKHLSSVTLELGGKSPAIIGPKADLDLAAEKIAWGKFLNAGQTCVAPDYVYVPTQLKDSFVELLKAKLKKNYPGHGLLSDYTGIISHRHKERLKNLLNESAQSNKSIFEMSAEGFQEVSAKKIFPTLIINPDPHSQLMKEEIFGPLLPIITYDKVEEVTNHIQNDEKPLALYIFSQDQDFQEHILRHTSSGGVCINDVIIHLANPHLPFGGVGPSGMGNYHGFFGFKAFSHERAVLKQGALSALMKVFYPPYTPFKHRLMDLLLRFVGKVN